MVSALSEEFRIVYKVVVRGERVSLSNELLKRCIEVAAKNKVLLHFLRRANVESFARLHEEARYRRFVEMLSIVAEALEGLSHVFIKLRKPVIYVPSDIDVLIDRNEIGKAVSKLRSRGFRVEVMEPYAITMTRGGAVVDLYVYPTLGGVIYVDGSKLFEHSEVAEVHGLRIPVLKSYAEALLAAAHAIYKERIYTLNDYVTTRLWLSSRAAKLAEELECIDAVKISLAINHLVEEQNLGLPYKVPLIRWIEILERKIARDRLSRATIPNLAKALASRRFGNLVVSKIFREAY